MKSPDNLEWRWYIKPTSARGPESSLCYGYGMCFHEYNDPQECFSFHVYDGSKFTYEKDVICIMEKGQQGDDDDDKNDINDNESGAVNSQQDDKEDKNNDNGNESGAAKSQQDDDAAIQS